MLEHPLQLLSAFKLFQISSVVYFGLETYTLPLIRIIFSGIHLPRLSTLIKKKEEEEEGKYINPDFYIHPRYYLMKCGILVRAWYSVKVNNPDNTLRLSQ